MTGAGVLKRLLANPHLSDRYRNTHVMPLQVRVMLNGVCELVAFGEEPGTYRLQPEIDGEATMAGRLARRLDAFGAEAQIDQGLDLLARLGFLLRPDADCIVVPACIPKRAKPGVTDGPKDKGGRPRTGENATARKQRLAAEQARSRTQGDLKLPIAGGQDKASPVGETLAETLRSRFVTAGGASVKPRGLPERSGASSEDTDVACSRAPAHDASGPETSPANLPETPAAPLAKPETETCTENLKHQVSVSLASVAESGLAEESIDSQDSARLSNSASATREGIAETCGETGERFSERNPIEVSAAGVAPSVVSETEPFARPGGASARAPALAARAAAKHQWSEAAAANAVNVMQRYMDEGYSVAEIEDAIAQPRSCKSAAYYKPVLDELRRRAKQAAPASQPAARAQTPEAPPIKRDPRILDHPAWCKLDRAQQITLEWMLEAMDVQDPVKRGRKLRPLEGRYFHLWEAFIRRYPEAKEMSRFTELDLPAA